MSKFDPFKLDSLRAQIEAALAPSRAMQDIVRAMQPPASLTALEDLSKRIELPTHIEAIAKGMQPPAELTAVGQTMIAMERERAILANLAGPPRVLDEMMTQKSGLSRDLLDAAGETLLTEMNNDQLLRFVALDINQAMES